MPEVKSPSDGAEQKAKGTLQAGRVAELVAVRSTGAGVFLDAGTGNTSDDILLHVNQQTAPVNVGDKVKVYLYLDPSKRLTASMKLPDMEIGQVARRRVINVTKIGAFVDIGTERGVFLPLRETIGRLRVGDNIWVRQYMDKTGRRAVTMKVDKEIALASRKAVGVKKGDMITGSVYNITKDGCFLFTPEKYIAFLHNSELGPDDKIFCGEDVTARVAFVREDGRLNVSLHKQKEFAIKDDAQKILDTLVKRGGPMPYSDDSPSEILKRQFGISKAAFKRALGTLLKEGRVYQKDGWTYLNEDKNKESGEDQGEGASPETKDQD